MKKIFSFIIISLSIIFSHCSSAQNNIEITLTNPNNIERVDEYVTLSVNSVQKKYPDFDPASFTIYEKDVEIPYQIEEKNGEKLLILVIDFAPLEKKVLTIKNDSKTNKEYKSRVYAEVAMKVDYQFKDGKYSGGRFQNYDSLRVPDGHTDHNALFKYEGPGWESDKVGYRYYIDWRNRIDIFGKTTNELILKNVGVNDREAKDDSYHKMQDWGMDIFKVGNSLGIGSYGMFQDSIQTVSERDSVFCIITENGPIKAEVTTDFYGWKVGNNNYDLKSILSITAGSRLTKTELVINNNPENLVTGLAKNEIAEFIENKSNKWSYIALYGKQSLAEDNLGIALFYNNDELIELKETNDSYAVLLNPVDGTVKYYFCAAWEKETKGIKSKEEFLSYLNNTLEKLSNPILTNY
jgi:hypothetical protein